MISDRVARLIRGWQLGRFLVNEDGQLAYLPAQCEAKRCECDPNLDENGAQDCSVALDDIDDAPADAAVMLNTLIAMVPA